MRNLSFSVLALLSVIFLATTSCDKQTQEGEGTVRVKWTLTWDGTPVHMTQRMMYETGDSFFIDRVNTYITNLTLKGDKDQLLADVELIDFTSLMTPASAITGTERTYTVPAGHYTSLDMGIGVPADDNAKNPADFEAGNPLAQNGMYWDGWASYIFSKIEGRLDSDDNGQFDVPIAYHTGSDPIFRTFNLVKSIHVEEGIEKSVSLQIDLKKLVNGINLKTDAGTHTLGDTALSVILANNFVGGAISVF
jgi:hypothetical protein